MEIALLLQDIVLNAIKRTKDNLETNRKPFQTALLDEEIIKLSSFERSSSTSFGQKYVEETARIIALSTGAKAERQRQTFVNVYQGAHDEIEKIIDGLKSHRARPDWRGELSYVTAHNCSCQNNLQLPKHPKSRFSLPFPLAAFRYGRDSLPAARRD